MEMSIKRFQRGSDTLYSIVSTMLQKNLIEVSTIECLRNANKGANFGCLLLRFTFTNSNPFVG